MKKTPWFTGLAAALLLTACESKSPNGKKAEAGADKIAQGIKEVAGAAAEQTAVQMEVARQNTKEVVERVQRDLETRDGLKEEARQAANATAAALESAKDKVGQAASQIKEAIQEPVEKSK